MRRLLADTRPLRSAPFRRLWVASIVTVIGAQLTVVAVPAQIYALTGSSAYVGLTGLFGLVPLIVFGLWGGALADHVDRRLLLLVTTVGIIATSGLFWLLTVTGSADVWTLLVVFALQQACFAVNQPTRTAILPRILPAGQLAAANALTMTVLNAGAIAGPLVGGALIPVLGFGWLYGIDTLTLLATLWAVLLLPPLPVEGRSTSRTPGLRSIVEGLRYLAGHRILLVSFLVDLVAMGLGMPRALFPEIAHVNFGGPPSGGLAFALLYAAIPAGAVLGGVFSGWVSLVDRTGAAVLWAIAGWGLAIVAFGAAAALGPADPALFLALGVAALVAAGVADMVSAAFRQTILLAGSDDAVRGRLQGVFIVVVVGGPRLADVWHGGVAAAAGAAVTTVAGGLAVLVGIVAMALAVPAFGRFRLSGASGAGRHG